MIKKLLRLLMMSSAILYSCGTSQNDQQSLIIKDRIQLFDNFSKNDSIILKYKKLYEVFSSPKTNNDNSFEKYFLNWVDSSNLNVDRKEYYHSSITKTKELFLLDQFTIELLLVERVHLLNVKKQPTARLYQFSENEFVLFFDALTVNYQLLKKISITELNSSPVDLEGKVQSIKGPVLEFTVHTKEKIETMNGKLECTLPNGNPEIIEFKYAK